MKHLFLIALLLASCSADSASQGAVAQAKAPSQTEVAKAQGPKDLLKPWHHVEEKWFAEATHIFVASYQESDYHEFHANGHDTILIHILNVERQFKGKLGRTDLNFRYDYDPNPRFPERFSPDRKYLVLLKPDAESLKVLSNADLPYNTLRELGSQDFVAVIDLHQTQREAQKRAKQIEEFQAFQTSAASFDSSHWRWIRTRPGATVAELRSYQFSLQRKALPKCATQPQAEAFLGKPDEVTTEGALRWAVNLADVKAKKEGQVLLFIELSFGKDGRIQRYEEKLSHVHGGNIEPMSYEQAKSAGMTWSSVHY